MRERGEHHGAADGPQDRAIEQVEPEDRRIGRHRRQAEPQQGATITPAGRARLLRALDRVDRDAVGEPGRLLAAGRHERRLARHPPAQHRQLPPPEDEQDRPRDRVVADEVALHPEIEHDDEQHRHGGGEEHVRDGGEEVGAAVVAGPQDRLGELEVAVGDEPGAGDADQVGVEPLLHEAGDPGREHPHRHAERDRADEHRALDRALQPRPLAIARGEPVPQQRLPEAEPREDRGEDEPREDQVGVGDRDLADRLRVGAVGRKAQARGEERGRLVGNAAAHDAFEGPGHGGPRYFRGRWACADAGRPARATAGARPGAGRRARGRARTVMRVRRPLLLLPRPVDEFVLGDHARELLDTAGGAVALPGRVPYGALTRAPGPMRGGVARTIAGHLAHQIPGDWTPSETVLVAYHAIQWPAVRALMARGAASELWYCRWDRYEEAQDAGRLRELLREWHEAMATASTLTFAVSGRLAELEEEAERAAITVGLSADDFPDGPLEPTPRGAELIAAAGADRPPVLEVDPAAVDQPATAPNRWRCRSVTSGGAPTGPGCAAPWSDSPICGCCSSARGMTTRSATTPTTAGCVPARRCVARAAR